jgi:hypothetical protein
VAYITGLGLGEQSGIMLGEQDEGQQWEKRLPNFDEEEHDWRRATGLNVDEE